MVNRFGGAIKNTEEKKINQVEQQDGENGEFVIELEEFFHKKEGSSIGKEALKENQINEFVKVSEFLKETVSKDIYELRLNKLKEMMDVLIYQDETKEALMIIDKTANINQWINAIKYAVPEKLRSILIFNKNENMDNKDYTQCMVFNNHVFNDIDEVFEEKNYNYHIFDLSTINYNNFNKNAKYSELVQVGYMSNSNQFHEFITFFDKFEYNNLDINIEYCLMLFYYLISGSLVLDYKNIVKAIDFAENYGNSKVYKNIFNKMKLNINVDEEMAFLTIGFMLKASKITEEKEYYSKTYGYIFDYLNQFLQNNKSKNLDNIYELYNKIYELEANSVEEFIDYGLDFQTINKLEKNISDNDSSFAIFYLTVILKALNERGNKWRDNNAYLDFIDISLDSLVDDFNAVKSIMNSMNCNLEYKANLLVLYYKKVSKNELKKQQIVKYFAEEEVHNKEITGFIIKLSDGISLVFNEFKHNLVAAADKVDFFWFYKDKVFDKNENFKIEYFSQTVDFYLKSIKDEVVYNEEFTKLLNLASNNQVEISDEVLTYFINDYENRVPLVGIDMITQLNLKNIEKIKKAKGIVTTSFNFYMMEFGKEVESANNSEQINLLIQNQVPDLRPITEIKLVEFFDWSLDLLFNNEIVGVNDIFAFYNKVIEKRGETGEELLNGIFESYRFKILNKSIDIFSAKKVQFYLLATMEYLIKQKKVWDSDGEKEGFIKKAIVVLGRNKDMLQRFLEEIVEHDSYFVEILSQCQVEHNCMEIAIDFFNKYAKLKGAIWVNNIMSLMEKCEDGPGFLFKIFVDNLMVVKNKREFFWDFIEDIEAKYPKLKSEKISDVFENYIMLSDGREISQEEDLKLLNYIMLNNIEVNKELLIKLVINFEYSLDIALPNKELEILISKISSYKKSKNIVTYPDIIDIVNYSFSIEKTSTSDLMLEKLKSASINLTGLNKDKYFVYIQRLLPVIGNKLNIIENAEKINKVLCLESYKEEYDKLYNDVIIDQLNKGSIKLSRENFKVFINNNKESFELVANLVLVYFNKALKSDDVTSAVEFFIEIIDLSEVFNLKAMEIRKYFIKFENGGDLLFEEYKYGLSSNSNKVAFFSGYWNGMSNYFQDYKGMFYSRAIEVFLKCIKNSDNYAEDCYGILKQIKNENVTLSNEIMVEIISAAETLIKIGEQSPKQQNIIKDITKFKFNKNVYIKLDTVCLINFGDSLDQVNDLEEMKEIILNADLELEGLEFSRYEEWLEWCLPKVIICADTWKMHSSIKKALCRSNFNGIFFTIYIGKLSELLISEGANGKNKNISFDDIFAQFIMFFINEREQLGGDTYIQGRANIINALARCSNSKINEIDKLILKDFNNLNHGDMIVDEWKKIQSRVAPLIKKDKSIFSIFKK